MTVGDEEPGGPPAGAARQLEGAPTQRRRLQRTTTMLAYRREPLLVSQQHAAEAAVAAAATPRPAPSRKGPSLEGVAEEGEEVPSPRTAEAEREAANAWAVGGTCEAKYWSSPGGCRRRCSSGRRVWAEAASVGAHRLCLLRVPAASRHPRPLARTVRSPPPAHAGSARRFPTAAPPACALPGDAGFKLRGASYLADKKKVPATPPMFELVRRCEPAARATRGAGAGLRLAWSAHPVAPVPPGWGGGSGDSAAPAGDTRCTAPSNQSPLAPTTTAGGGGPAEPRGPLLQRGPLPALRAVSLAASVHCRPAAVCPPPALAAASLAASLRCRLAAVCARRLPAVQRACGLFSGSVAHAVQLLPCVPATCSWWCGGGLASAIACCVPAACTHVTSCWPSRAAEPPAPAARSALPSPPAAPQAQPGPLPVLRAAHGAVRAAGGGGGLLGRAHAGALARF